MWVEFECWWGVVGVVFVFVEFWIECVVLMVVWKVEVLIDVGDFV